MKRTKKYKTETERKEAKRLATARYRRTEKVEKNIAKYSKSVARKKSLAKYNKSKKNKLNQKRYYSKPKAKLKRKLASRKYKRSEKGRKYHREYQRTSKYRLYANSLRRKKYKNDSNFKIRISFANRTRKILKRYNATKKDTFSNLLGCSVKTFKTHIEKQFKPWMNWDNHSAIGWHFDHIQPCASFDLNDESQQKICFNYKNIQPLKAETNLKKGKK